MAFDVFKGRQVDGDWTMGASFFTTSEDAKERWNTLLQATNNLNEDISLWFRKNKTSEEAAQFSRQWSNWRDTVYSEYKDNARRKIIPDLAANVWNRGDTKLIELKEWRGRFEKLSGTSATAPGPEAQEQHEPKKSGTSPWAYAALALAGAVGFVLVQRKVG